MRKVPADYQPIILHPMERNLIEYIRQQKFGSVLIKVQDSLPQLIERAVIKVKLGEPVERVK